ncbi:MAG: tetratricopeptide repeat protein [Nitrospirota bacterium]
MKRVTLYMLLFCLLFFINQVSFAEKQGKTDTENSFSEANRLYEKGRYDDAVKAYERLLSHGIESGSIYYNLGNAYFKKGELSRAILNYERARLFIPDDSDLRFNQEYAVSLLSETPQEDRGGWFTRTLNRLSERFSVNGLTILLSSLYMTICIILIIRIYADRIRRFYIPLISILVVFLISGAFLLNNKVSHIGREAIVVTKEAKAKFEPFDSATTYFSLSEGNKIEVIEKKDDWYRIKRGDGKVGWINKAMLEII